MLFFLIPSPGSDAATWSWSAKDARSEESFSFRRCSSTSMYCQRSIFSNTHIVARNERHNTATSSDNGRVRSRSSATTSRTSEMPTPTPEAPALFPPPPPNIKASVATVSKAAFRSMRTKFLRAAWRLDIVFLCTFFCVRTRSSRTSISSTSVVSTPKSLAASPCSSCRGFKSTKKGPSS